MLRNVDFPIPASIYSTHFPVVFIFNLHLTSHRSPLFVTLFITYIQKYIYIGKYCCSFLLRDFKPQHCALCMYRCVCAAVATAGAFCQEFSSHRRKPAQFGECTNPVRACILCLFYYEFGSHIWLFIYLYVFIFVMYFVLISHQHLSVVNFMPVHQLFKKRCRKRELKKTTVLGLSATQSETFNLTLISRLVGVAALQSNSENYIPAAD